MEDGRPKAWALRDICLCQCGTKPPALRTAPQICLGLPAHTSESILCPLAPVFLLPCLAPGWVPGAVWGNEVL